MNIRFGPLIMLPQHLHQSVILGKDVFKTQENVAAMWKACTKTQLLALYHPDSARGASTYPEP